MSLILEALRKSEAERRRGRAPDLSAELPPPPAARRRASWQWWLPALGAAALLVAAVLSWRPQAPNADDPAARSAGERGDVPQRDRQRAIAGAEQPTAPPPFPRIERIPAPAAPRAEPPAATASPPAATATSPAASAPRAGADAEPGAAPPPAPQPPTPPERTTADTPAMPPAVPSAAAAAPAIRYTELPQAERQQLPAMKLTMHMWNERPAQRFVIVDGQRYAEGDRIGSGRVAAIDTEGLLIELNGRTVRVPLR